MNMGAPQNQCTMDAQCTAGANGRCFANGGGPLPACQCTYDACTHDADCSAGSTCACHGSAYMPGVGNGCVAGNCRVDTDCGPAGFCSPTIVTLGCGTGVAGYYCHTPADQCTNDRDCPTQPQGQGFCAYSVTARRWQCTTVGFCQ